jgi:hypothetical protein
MPFPLRPRSSLGGSAACSLLAAIAGLALALAPLPAAAQADGAVRTTSGTVRLDADGRVTVENHEGSIAIDTWDRDEVRYEARIEPETGADHPRRTVVRLDRSNNAFTIATDYDPSAAEATEDDDGGLGDLVRDLLSGNGSRNIMPVHYTLTVPATAAVTIDDHESTIEIAGLQGTARVDTHDGAVRVRDQSGRLEVDTHDGPVRIEGQTGDVLVESHDGRIEMSRVAGAVRIDTHESDVRIDGLEGDLEVDGHEPRVAVRGLRGGLAVDGHEPEVDVAFDAFGRDVHIDTHEGRARLALAAGTGFRIDTDFSDDASLRSDVDLSGVRIDRDDEVNYRGDVLGGGPRIRLSSHDGSFEIRTRSDTSR